MTNRNFERLSMVAGIAVFLLLLAAVIFAVGVAVMLVVAKYHG